MAESQEFAYSWQRAHAGDNKIQEVIVPVVIFLVIAWAAVLLRKTIPGALQG